MICPRSCAAALALAALKRICALVKERRLGRVQVLGRLIGIERPPAERNDAAFQVRDGEHHTVAEPVVRHRNVFAGNQHARGHHLRYRETGLGEVVFQNRATGRCEAEPEVRDGLSGQPTLVEVAARFRAIGGRKLVLEKGPRRFEQGIKALALVVAGRILGGPAGWQGQSCLDSQPLDGLGERQSFGLHHEREDVAVLP